MCALLTLILPVWEAVAWTTVIGFVYEGGQADVAYSQKLLGKPGYGIGLIDLVADVLGALSWIGIRALFLG